MNFGVNCSHRLTIFTSPSSFTSALSTSSLFSPVCSPILTYLPLRPDTSLVLTVWQGTFSFPHQPIAGITQDTSIFILLFVFSVVSAAIFSWQHRIIWEYWWEYYEWHAWKEECRRRYKWSIWLYWLSQSWLTLFMRLSRLPSWRLKLLQLCSKNNIPSLLETSIDQV